MVKIGEFFNFETIDYFKTNFFIFQKFALTHNEQVAYRMYVFDPKSSFNFEKTTLLIFIFKNLYLILHIMCALISQGPQNNLYVTLQFSTRILLPFKYITKLELWF